ncbi:hypothetical protein HMPREF1870_02837 [Bacteroidales bacterium KA00344]|nr:hypothetical protein HMPREF1870_02837 [Bacteroidales bacterium KA00344]
MSKSMADHFLVMVAKLQSILSMPKELDLKKMKAPLLEEWVRGVVFYQSSEICVLFSICCFVCYPKSEQSG